MYHVLHDAITHDSSYLHVMEGNVMYAYYFVHVVHIYIYIYICVCVATYTYSTSYNMSHIIILQATVYCIVHTCTCTFRISS